MVLLGMISRHKTMKPICKRLKRSDTDLLVSDKILQARRYAKLTNRVRTRRTGADSTLLYLWQDHGVESGAESDRLTFSY